MSQSSGLRRLDEKVAARLRAGNPTFALLLPSIVALGALGLLVLVLLLTGHLQGALHGCLDRGPNVPCSPAVFWNLGWPTLLVAVCGYGYVLRRDIWPRTEERPEARTTDGRPGEAKAHGRPVNKAVPQVKHVSTWTDDQRRRQLTVLIPVMLVLVGSLVFFGVLVTRA